MKVIFKFIICVSGYKHMRMDWLSLLRFFAIFEKFGNSMFSSFFLLNQFLLFSEKSLQHFKYNCFNFDETKCKKIIWLEFDFDLFPDNDRQRESGSGSEICSKEDGNGIVERFWQI